MNTSTCGFQSTPQYWTSLGGSSRQGNTTGVNAIYNPTATGFRVYVYDTTRAVTPAQADQDAWHVNWEARPSGSSGVCSGVTSDTDWIQHNTNPNGIFQNVNTSACALSGASVPSYFTSILGASRHRSYVGATSIYSPTPTGFRVYLYSTTGPITPADAAAFDHRIQWSVRQ